MNLITSRLVALWFQLVLLLVAVTANEVANAQGWRPAVTLEEVRVIEHYIQLEDGTTLLPISRLLPNQGDTFLLFSVEQLLTDKQPWPVQLPGDVRRVHRVYQSNSNDHADVVYSTHADFETQLLLDAFTDQQRLRPALLPGGSQPASGVTVFNIYAGDLDGDGIDDDFAIRPPHDGLAYITYGDSLEPYMEESWVLATPDFKPPFEPRIVAIGKLSGKPVMLQAMFKSEYNGSGHYQLLELNQDDLTNRRDTIRTTLLNETPNPDLWLFNSVILKADTVWHLFPSSLSSSIPALKVTLNESSIAPTESEIRVSDHRFWFGQRKSTGDWSFPVVIEADRFIIADALTSEQARVLRLFKCTNTDNAELTVYAEGLIPGGTTQLASFSRAMLIPDYDGDGLEDIVIYRLWNDETTNEPKSGTSIFLTTQIPPVSVSNNESVFYSDTSQALNAYFTGTQWVVPQAAWCTSSGSGGPHNASQHNVAVYSITGELITHLTATAQATDLVITHDTSLPQAPMWAVVGECVVQLR